MAVKDTEKPSGLEPLYTLAEAREILRISEASLWRAVRRGDLAVIEIGSRRLIEPAALRAFIASRRRRVSTRSGP